MNLEDYRMVIENCKCLTINADKILPYTNKLDISHQQLDNDEFPNELTVNEEIIWILISESINFCFWPEKNWKTSFHGKTYTGSVAMFKYLLKALESGKLILDLDKLETLSFNEFVDIFDGYNKPNGLFEERYNNFVETIKVLKSQRDTIFTKITNFTSDNELMCFITSNFKSFDDYSIFNDKIIHFNKRAILVVRDIFQYLPHDKIKLTNISSLTACADYVLPSIFRDEGILVYEKYLAEIVDHGYEIKQNSVEEIAIRSAVICIVEEIKNALKFKGVDMCSAILDWIIWKNAKSRPQSSMRHHTKSIFY